MTSLQNKMMETQNIELGICFMYPSSQTKVFQHGVVYYPIPHPHKSFMEKVNEFLHMSSITIEEPRWKYYITRFKNVIEDFNPDIIHVFGSELYMGLVAMATNRPLVLHIQGILNTCYNALYGAGISRHDYIFQDKNPKKIYQRYVDDLWWKRNCYREKQCLLHVKHFIGRTEWDRRVSSLLSPNAVYHFGEELMRSTFYEPKERILPEKLTISTVISLASYKGLDLILKTADILKNMMHVDFSWNVYGNVDSRFAEKITGLDHKALNIHLKGVVDAEQLKDIHSSSTVYYHSSYIENSSNAIVEAQMCACTPIANYVGGLSTLIKDGETGFCVPANDPYQTAYLIKYLYDNPQKNLEIGKTAQDTVMVKHDQNAIFTGLLKIYEDVICETKKI